MLTALQSGGCPWCGGMGWGGGMMMFFWVVVLVALVALAWSLLQRRSSAGYPPADDRAEEILKERFARGEIDDASYQRMLEELRR